MLAVIIGSGAWPSGVPGLGQGKVADYLNSLVADYLDGAEDAVKDDKEMYAKVIKWAAEKAKHLKGIPTNRRFNEDVLGGCMGGWMGGWLDGWLYGWICQGWLGMVGDGWISGWLDDWMAGWLDGWLDGWLYGLLFGWLYGWLDGWVAGWLDGWMGGWIVGYGWT